jgi:predicted RNase H-like HicB family nuclease
MKYDIAMQRVPNGFRASVPALPGCWVEGATEAHAMTKVEVAIGDYLAKLDEQMDDQLANEAPEAIITP